MPVDVKDLPPAYQMQALRKLAEREKRRTPIPSPAVQKASKYHNRKDERAAGAGASIQFDSKKEARRYDELMAMLQAGEIRGLKLQPQFTLQEAYTTTEGVRVRAIRYQADFSYEKRAEYWRGYEGQCPDDGWRLVVEDVKSRATKTRVYAMKKKLMQEKFGIDIQEV